MRLFWRRFALGGGPTSRRSLVLVGLGLSVGEGLVLGVGLGLSNQIAISRRGVIIWQGVENGHNTSRQSGKKAPTPYMKNDTMNNFSLLLTS